MVSNTLRVYATQTISTQFLRQAYDPVLQRLYLVTPVTDSASGASLAIYDTVSGSQIASVPSGLTDPELIAVSDDGEFVYLTGGASGLQIVRFNVAAGAFDLGWQAALPPLAVAASIQAIFVATGSPETLIVTLSYQPGLPNYRNGGDQDVGGQTVIYDGAVPRFLTALDSGVQLYSLIGAEFIWPFAAFASGNRVIFENLSVSGGACWQWLDFDSFSVEGGSSVCGPEPPELVHDHGVSYLTDGNRTLVVTFPGGAGTGYQPILLVDPNQRSAWSLAQGTLTTLNLDSLAQSASSITSIGIPEALYRTPSGPLLVTSSSFYPIP